MTVDLLAALDEEGDVGELLPVKKLDKVSWLFIIHEVGVLTRGDRNDFVFGKLLNLILMLISLCIGLLLLTELISVLRLSGTLLVDLGRLAAVILGSVSGLNAEHATLIIGRRSREGRWFFTGEA